LGPESERRKDSPSGNTRGSTLLSRTAGAESIASSKFWITSRTRICPSETRVNPPSLGFGSSFRKTSRLTLGRDGFVAVTGTTWSSPLVNNGSLRSCRVTQ
jgi:hypothetical protein